MYLIEGCQSQNVSIHLDWISFCQVLQRIALMHLCMVQILPDALLLPKSTLRPHQILLSALPLLKSILKSHHKVQILLNALQLLNNP